MQNEILYFKDRKGNLYTKQTKNEIKESINPIVPETFIHILKDMDYPYFEDEWGIILAHTALNGDLKNVISKYISKMRLHDFKNFSFKDSKYNKNLTEFRLNSYGINIKDGHYKYSINHLTGIRNSHYIDYEHFHNCRPNEEDLKKENGCIFVEGHFPKKISKGTYIKSKYPYVSYSIIREFKALLTLEKPLVVCATSGHSSGDPFLLKAVEDCNITLGDEYFILNYEDKRQI